MHFASNSDWLVVLFTSVAKGQSKNFGFGFTILNWKPLLFANNVHMLKPRLTGHSLACSIDRKINQFIDKSVGLLVSHPLKADRRKGIQ